MTSHDFGTRLWTFTLRKKIRVSVHFLNHAEASGFVIVLVDNGTSLYWHTFVLNVILIKIHHRMIYNRDTTSRRFLLNQNNVYLNNKYRHKNETKTSKHPTAKQTFVTGMNGKTQIPHQ